MTIFIPDHIQSIAPYEPGKPVETLAREAGVRDAIKLASNENPLGASPKAIGAIRQALDHLHRYPDGAAFNLTERLAAKTGVDPRQIVLGNGSDDILAMLARVLLGPGDEVIIPQPSFLMYDIVTRSAGATPVTVPLDGMRIDLAAVLAQVTERTRLVFICNPNNPTGTVVSTDEFQAFLQALPPDIVIVVDEAYIDFVRDPNCLNAEKLLDETLPMVVLRTFSKAFGLAGLRIGYGLMPVELAQMLHRVRMPFNVNALAQAAAAAALEDDQFLDLTLRTVHQGLDDLYDHLDKRGLTYYRTQANFFLIDVGTSADEVFQAMLAHGVIVRSMRAYGFPSCIRINAGKAEENRRFIKALDQVLQSS